MQLNSTSWFAISDKTSFNTDQANVTHCVKSVHTQSFSSSYFPAFGLNTERYGLSLRIRFKYEKIRTRKTPNTDTFYALTII